jgi:hypothetical protein
VSTFTLEEAAQLRDEITERGQQIYESRLKAILEPGHNGDFVAVEPETGRYFICDKDAEALIKAHEVMPESHFYLRRIGYDFTHSLGGYGLHRR